MNPPILFQIIQCCSSKGSIWHVNSNFPVKLQIYSCWLFFFVVFLHHRLVYIACIFFERDIAFLHLFVFLCRSCYTKCDCIWWDREQQCQQVCRTQQQNPGGCSDIGECLGKLWDRSVRSRIRELWDGSVRMRDLWDRIDTLIRFKIKELWDWGQLDFFFFADS